MSEEDNRRMTEDRFQHIDGELSEVKSDVAGLKTGFGSLTSDFSHLRSEVTQGFSRLFDKIESQGQQPPRIGLPLIFSVIAILFPIIGMGAAVIMLVINPLSEKLTANAAENEEDRSNLEEKIELVRLYEGKLNDQEAGFHREVQALISRDVERLQKTQDGQTSATSNIFGRLQSLEKDVNRLNVRSEESLRKSNP